MTCRFAAKSIFVASWLCAKQKRTSLATPAAPLFNRINAV